MPTNTQVFLVYKKVEADKIDVLGEVEIDPLRAGVNAGKYMSFTLRDAIATKDVSVTDNMAIRLFEFDESTRKTGEPVDSIAPLEAEKTYCYTFKKRKAEYGGDHLLQQNGMNHDEDELATKKKRQELHDAVKDAKVESVGDTEEESLRVLSIASPHKWLTDSEDRLSGKCYIRDVYDILWERVQASWNGDWNKITDLLVIGNPGIGKSWSLNYLLHKALQTEDAHGRIIILRSTNGWYTFYNGECYESPTYIGREWLQQHGASLKDNRALILHDHLMNTNFVDMDYGPVSIVFASSPNRENYKAFEHRGRSGTFILPTWTLEEFTAFASIALDRGSESGQKDSKDLEEVVTYEFDTFGGVLRKAFRGGRTVQKIASDIATLGETIPTVTENNFVGDAPSRLFQLVPNKDYSALETVRFLSPEIERQFVKYRQSLSWAKRIGDLNSALSLILRRNMCGCEFEDCILDALKDHRMKIDFSNVTQLRPTDDVRVLDKTFTVPIAQKPDLPSFADSDDRLPLVFEGSGVTDFISKVGTSVSSWRLFAPKVPNYPLFDFMLVKDTSVYGVQVTVGSEHPAKGKAVAAWLEKCAPSATFQLKGIIFLVDSESQLSKWQGLATFETGWTTGKEKQKKLSVTGETGVKSFVAIPQWLFKVETKAWVNVFDK